MPLLVFMDSLAKLFGSAARVRLLRLFLFNDDSAFTLAEAAERARVPKDTARKELTLLSSVGVLRKRTGRTPAGYVADRRFHHYEALKTFMRATTDVGDQNILAVLKKAGNIRLVVLSGLFTGAMESKIDLLVVGDKLEERPLTSAIHILEAELGRELRFATFSTEDFRYRLGVYDRLLRDLFDFPNKVVLDKVGLAAK